jgi:two-component system, NtrC family, nitrogen regulation sensor histidine kinase NtrY
MNRAAESMLRVSAAACVGKAVDEVFSGDAAAEVRQLMTDLGGDGATVPRYAVTVGGPVCTIDGQGGHGARVERQFKLEREGREMAVLLTGTRLADEGNGLRGYVLFLEEVTHLLRVQRMEAWREVARRIAHEIKNPLTPIQLSAQRLRRRFGAQLTDGAPVFDECTRTIIQQVDELKALVNEFATFARMPAGEHTSQELNPLVEEALVLFREGHREVDFAFSPGADVPVLELDREGMKRAVINILDNAVAACSIAPAAAGERGCVELRTSYDAKLDVVRLEIADNGPGMSPEVKARLFEPYFSTKPDGTGLGLAIVSAIVADHNGFIRIRDNVPRGSRFVMELPVRRTAVQLAVGGAAYGRA